MKIITSKYLLLMVFTIILQIGYAQNLVIINQDYELAKSECKKQNKLLIIDFYTTWCAPCKQLDQMIFKDSLVSKKIAKNFIVLKYDAEQDSTHKLSLKYHVALYPTTVILNTDQYIVNKLYGLGGSIENLVENYLAFLAVGIANGRDNIVTKGVSNSTHQIYPKFYTDYVYRINTKNVDEKIKNYWDNTTDYTSEVSFAILSYFGGGNDAVNTYFLNNIAFYEDLYGKLDVSFISSMLIRKKFDEALKLKDRSKFENAVVYAKANTDKATINDFLNMMEERMLISENKWDLAIEKFIERKKAKNFSDDSINSFCWDAYKNCNDKNVLNKCTQWIKAIAVKNPNYETLDTYARLLYKIDNKKLSKTVMEQAIKAGKLNKDNTKDSENWLNKNFAK